MRLSVRRKILATLLLIILLMGSHSLLSTHVLSTLERRAGDVLARHTEASSLVTQLLRHAQTVHDSALILAREASPEAITRSEEEMRLAIAESQALIQRLSEANHAPDELAKLDDFQGAWGAYADVLTERLAKADRSEVETLLRDDGAAGIAAQEAFRRLDALAEATRTAAERSLARIEHERWRAQFILLGLVLVAAAISVLFALHTTSRVGSAVNSIRNAARLVAEGDLEWSVAVNSGDELQDIAESLTKLARRTRQSLATSRETTEQLQRQMSESRVLEGGLTTARNRLDAAISLVRQAVILTDSDGQITLLSPLAAELTAWRREQALGVPLDEVLHLLDDTTGERRPSPADEAVHGQRMVQRSKRAILVNKDGARRPIIMDSAPVLDGAKQIAGTVIVFHEAEKGSPRTTRAG
jgi:PAS domain S-box-containing protein